MKTTTHMKIEAPRSCNNHRFSDSLLITAREAARLCGRSLRCWRTWDASGQIPRPVRIGSRSTLWRADELREWIAAGCPPREAWEARK